MADRKIDRSRDYPQASNRTMAKDKEKVASKEAASKEVKKEDASKEIKKEPKNAGGSTPDPMNPRESEAAALLLGLSTQDSPSGAPEKPDTVPKVVTTGKAATNETVVSDIDASDGESSSSNAKGGAAAKGGRKKPKLEIAAASSPSKPDADAPIDPTSAALVQAGKGGKKPAPFIQKLYHIFETSSEIIAGWSSDGEMIVIKDPIAFTKEVIPKYFVHQNYSSFERQLNFYSFRKVHTGPIRNDECDGNSEKYRMYHHVNFRRGRTDLLTLIRRASKASGAPVSAEDHAEVGRLKEKVNVLQGQLSTMVSDFEGLMHKVPAPYWSEPKQLMDQLLQSKIAVVAGTDHPTSSAAAAVSSPSSSSSVKRAHADMATSAGRGKARASSSPQKRESSPAPSASEDHDLPPAEKPARLEHKKLLNVPVFLAKTFDMISECDEDVACWIPSGKAFVIKSKQILANKYIPLYFDHSQYTSFDRQLHFYGFRKTFPKTMNPGGKNKFTVVQYHHEFFLRDNPEQMARIQRSTKSKRRDDKPAEDVELFRQQVSKLESGIEAVQGMMTKLCGKFQAEAVPGPASRIDLPRGANLPDMRMYDVPEPSEAELMRSRRQYWSNMLYAREAAEYENAAMVPGLMRNLPPSLLSSRMAAAPPDMGPSARDYFAMGRGEAYFRGERVNAFRPIDRSLHGRVYDPRDYEYQSQVKRSKYD